MAIKPKELVVGRFWKRDGPDGWPYYRGYIDLGIMGRIMVKMVPSPKRPGKQDRDSDMSLVVDVSQTPLGMLAVVYEKIQEALYEDEDPPRNDG
jgi:hypothetical protein